MTLAIIILNNKFTELEKVRALLGMTHDALRG